MRARLALLLIAATVVAGCGSEGSRGGDNELATTDAASIQEALRAINATCGSDGPTAADTSPAQIASAVSTIAGLVRAYPDRVYETGNVVKTEKLTNVARDTTQQLQRCGIPAQAARLKSVSG